MHGTGVKITDAQQAKIYNMYKNTKLRLLKTNAAIWFKKIRKTKQLTPKYFNIKINGNNNQTRKTRLRRNFAYVRNSEALKSLQFMLT